LTLFQKLYTDFLEDLMIKLFDIKYEPLGHPETAREVITHLPFGERRPQHGFGSWCMDSSQIYVSSSGYSSFSNEYRLIPNRLLRH
jgi:hypothetical protein